MREHTVPNGVQATTLARYLSRAYPMTPGHVWRDTFAKKDVRVNGVRANAGTMLSAGDCVRVYLAEDVLFGPVRTIERDGDIWAVEKEPGLPVDVDQDGVGEDTLLSRLMRVCPRAKLAHRLDAGTGGVVLASVSDAGEKLLRDAFEAHRVEKIYLAQLSARPPQDEGTLLHYLCKDAQRAYVRAYAQPRPGARSAQLSYSIVRAGDLPVARISLVTGRTHQIRCQFAAIGCALVGDDKYGDRDVNRRLGASFPRLWCAKMVLCAPGYEGKVFFSKPTFYDGDV